MTATPLETSTLGYRLPCYKCVRKERARSTHRGKALSQVSQPSQPSLSSLLHSSATCEYTGTPETRGTSQNVVSSSRVQERITSTQHGRWHHSLRDMDTREAQDAAH